MSRKGSANRLDFRRDVVPDVKDAFMKFRCSKSFKQLVKDYRAANPGYVAKRSEGQFITGLVLAGMFRSGRMDDKMITRIQNELEKVGI